MAGCGSASVGTDATVDGGGNDVGEDLAVEHFSDGPIGAHDTPMDVAADAYRADRAIDGSLGAPCWSDKDCNMYPPDFALCKSLDESFPCPVCYTPPSSCTSDQECTDGGATSICQPDACTCPSAMTCQTGCAADADCAAGSTCAANHRCAPKPCTTDVGCPTDFACVAGSECQRRLCTRDNECSVACVNGQCYERPGTCTHQPE